MGARIMGLKSIPFKITLTVNISRLGCVLFSKIFGLKPDVEDLSEQ